MGAFDDIERHEDRLRMARLTNDIDELKQLLGDDSIFTNQNGDRLTKAEDLSTYRSGLLKLTRIDAVGDRIVRTIGDTAYVCVTVQLEGSYGGQPFSGTFAYSRIWRRSHDHWRVELGHCSTFKEES